MAPSSKGIVCIIQARSGSSRLPEKVLMPIEGEPMLLHIIDRVLKSTFIDRVVVATTVDERDTKVAELISKHPSEKLSVFRGSEEDVLDRYYQAAKENGARIIVRLTGDCPLIDPKVIDLVISRYLEGDYDYVSNVLERTFPRGLDTEVFSWEVLERLWKECEADSEREHVTLRIVKHPDEFTTGNVKNVTDLSRYRWTVDEQGGFGSGQGDLSRTRRLGRYGSCLGALRKEDGTLRY
jgi:spore coat polysaccharide biosynthesis protein SpsF